MLLAQREFSQAVIFLPRGASLIALAAAMFVFGCVHLGFQRLRLMQPASPCMLN